MQPQCQLITVIQQKVPSGLNVTFIHSQILRRYTRVLKAENWMRVLVPPLMNCMASARFLTPRPIS